MVSAVASLNFDMGLVIGMVKLKQDLYEILPFKVFKDDVVKGQGLVFNIGERPVIIFWKLPLRWVRRFRG